MMKSQINMNQLNEKNLYRQIGKVGIGYTKKKENLSRKDLKRTKDLLAIIVVRQVIHQTNVGAMGKQNSMENATIAINMVVRLLNAKRNLSLKENATNATNMVTSHQNENLRY